MKKIGKKNGIGDILFHSINYLVFGLFALMCIYPFYYILMYSLSSPDKAASGTYLFPKGFTLDNYYLMFRNPGLTKALFITLARTVLGTAASVFCSAFMGYLFTKKELPMRKFLYRLVVMTMYINAGLIPYYMLLSNLKLINSFFVYIIPGLVGAFNVILIKTYIEQIPPAMEESAMVDGAGYFRIFIQLILPLSMPIIATVVVFNAVGHWNSFSDNLIFNPSGKYDTLQMVLYRVLARTTEAFQNVSTADMALRMKNVQLTPTTIRMTITMIATLPILFVYPFLQRYFVKGIMLGAIKG